MNLSRRIPSVILASALVAMISPLVAHETTEKTTSTDNNPPASGERTITLVVMDPLSLPLSCPCVEGYAQRKYEALQTFMQEELSCKVELVFDASLEVALEKTEGKADIVIGKDSVVRADAAAAGLPMIAMARLTDNAGLTEQHGLIVVNKLDPATTVEDLQGYTIIFGPSEAAEKHTAAKLLLQSAGVTIPKEMTIDEACSDGACKVIDLGPTSKSAAVISSYAQPLLEGCGTIKKGDLRVVGKTQPVPFITVFVPENMASAEQSKIAAVLGRVAEEPDLLVALESIAGFMPITQKDRANEVTSLQKKTPR